MYYYDDVDEVMDTLQENDWNEMLESAPANYEDVMDEKEGVYENNEIDQEMRPEHQESGNQGVGHQHLDDQDSVEQEIIDEDYYEDMDTDQNSVEEDSVHENSFHHASAAEESTDYDSGDQDSRFCRGDLVYGGWVQAGIWEGKEKRQAILKHAASARSAPGSGVFEGATAGRGESSIIDKKPKNRKFETHLNIAPHASKGKPTTPKKSTTEKAPRLSNCSIGMIIDPSELDNKARIIREFQSGLRERLLRLQDQFTGQDLHQKQRETLTNIMKTSEFSKELKLYDRILRKKLNSHAVQHHHEQIFNLKLRRSWNQLLSECSVPTNIRYGFFEDIAKIHTKKLNAERKEVYFNKTFPAEMAELFQTEESTVANNINDSVNCDMENELDYEENVQQKKEIFLHDKDDVAFHEAVENPETLEQEEEEASFDEVVENEESLDKGEDVTLNAEKGSYIRDEVNVDRNRKRQSMEANKLYCKCKLPNDENLPMVNCDKCDDWFHYRNANGDGYQHCSFKDTPDNLNKSWICDDCTEKGLEENCTVLTDEKYKSSTTPPTTMQTDNVANEGLLNSTDPVQSNTQSDQDMVQRVFGADQETVCSLLNLNEDELNYKLPEKFQVEFSSEEFTKIYDSESGIFLSSRGDVLSQKLHQSGVPCAFKIRRPAVKFVDENKGFARQEGYCSCGIKFDVQFTSNPIPGGKMTAIISTKGEFLLTQHKNTKRPIKGNERSTTAEVLKDKNSTKYMLSDLNDIDGLRVLHRSNKFSNTETLRKMKSEIAAKSRFSRDDYMDLQELEKHYEEAEGRQILGYMHDTNLKHGHFKTYMYTESSVRLLSSQLKKEVVVLGVDATGGLILPLKSNAIPPKTNVDPKIKNKNNILFYTTVAQTSKGSFVPAEMISERHRTTEVEDLFKYLRRNLKQVDRTLAKGVADIICCDFSFAMIHGVTEGANTMTLERYMNLSYDVLNKKTKVPEDVAVLQLCASHLPKSFLNNIAHKIPRTKHHDDIRSHAMKGLGRLMETTSLEEFRFVSKTLCELFDNKEINKEEQKQLLEQIKTPFSINTAVEAELSDDVQEEIKITEYDKLLREKSKFYHEFKRIRLAQKGIVNDDADSINELFCPEILDVLEKNYIPYYGLFSRGMGLQKDPNFTRVTNGASESKFRNVKHQLFDNPVSASEFIKRRKEYVSGENKCFLIKLPKRSYVRKQRAESSDSICENIDSHNAEEQWSKRRQNKAKPKHLSSKANLQKVNSNRHNIQPQASSATNMTNNDAEINETGNETDQENGEQWSNKASHVIDDIDDEDGNVLTFEETFQTEAEQRAFIKQWAGNPNDENSDCTMYSDEFENEDMHNKYIARDSHVFFRTPSHSGLTKGDFHSMFHGNRYLSDQIMDGYLAMLRDNSPTLNEELFVGSSYIVFYQNGKWNTSNTMLNDYNKEFHSHLMFPVNVGEHWILLKADVPRKSIQIYNPSKYGYEEQIAEMKQHLVPLLEEPGLTSNVDEWNIFHEKVPKQSDGNSCGVFCLKYATQIFHAFPMEPDFEIIDSPTQLRMDLTKEMLNTGPGETFLNFFGDDQDRFISFLKSRNPPEED